MRPSTSLATLGLCAALVTGCGLPWTNTPTADPPEVRAGELEAAAGRSCPQELPIGDDPSGHDVAEAADELPTLLEPQKAWVCRYDFFERGTTGDGGTVYGWRLTGAPMAVDDDVLPDLQDALDDLAVVDLPQDCNGDLGPRWLVAYSHDGDLTGVLVDDYGCREVRLTDDPHGTAPGDDGQEGTVGGVLDGGAEILDALGVGRWASGT
jgi:hypothetical protein